ncbi:NAD(P)/FAD-dependent oxidoreductase [Candidatus Uabimicrobium sp. HlEnr_7]|uniref:protoporphyrinogen/coproporphyrinogen oxidase n=1 Tax=Candidatus Uabimicrobium helgolandensis TaxID=3095367 RepID=UPI0035585732
MAENYDVVIVGSGLAGLRASVELAKKNISFVILEASSEVGGKLKTDKIDGFLLDHGFQVFQTSYPEAKNVLNYPDLKLGKFKNGALIRIGKRFERFVDPRHHPFEIFSALTSKVGSLGDKVRLLLMSIKLRQGTIPEMLQRREITTMQYLQSVGFSQSMIENFFGPFLSGVFLEKDLKTSSRVFEFVFRMFSSGQASLPEEGISAIPQQLLAKLPESSIQLNSKVNSISKGTVKLENGKIIHANNVLIATDAIDAHGLVKNVNKVSYSPAKCFYFATETPPITEPILVLNGNKGVINTLAVPSLVSSKYAPSGKHLVSITTFDEGDDLVEKISTEAETWFGEQVQQWQFLKSYKIDRAIPFFDGGKSEVCQKNSCIEEGIYYCGDYLDVPSINGALSSGKRAAETIINGLNS